jgi:dihydrofolate reductase
MQEIIIIAAMAENRVIGKDNAMPWSIKGNLAHFREMTMGWPCIMGRKTWESLPKKPLPGRLNIIISKTMTDSSVPQNELCPPKRALSPMESFVPQNELCPQKTSSVPKDSVQNIKIFPSLPSAIEYCAGYEKIFICGGETIYRQALPLANKIDLTLIRGQYEGDAFFPEIDTAIWKKINTVNFDMFSLITYSKFIFEKELT